MKKTKRILKKRDDASLIVPNAADEELIIRVIVRQDLTKLSETRKKLELNCKQENRKP